MKFTHYDYENNLVGLIPKRLLELSEREFKNRSSRNTLLKTYCLILSKVETEIKRGRNRGDEKKKYYVSLSSKYFRKSILTGYKRYLDFLISHGFVEVRKRELDFHERRKRGIYIDIHDDPIFVESYQVGTRSKEYTIKEFPVLSDQELRFPLRIKESPCRIKNRRFLESVGIEDVKMSSDQYGYRLYHNLTNSYKKVLPQLDQDFIGYDIKTSIPYQIKEYIKKKGYNDDPFLELFDGDFYENWGSVLGMDISDRKKVKRSFNTYLNGKSNDYPPDLDEIVKHKFPLFHSLKSKGLGKKMVRVETDLMLNKVIGNIPAEKVLTIHDGFIVFRNDIVIVDKYLNDLNELKEFTIVKKRM
ncbi:hypothetical protein J1N09_10115 [Aureitalea sp. L0-47]|uniref:hypothetical protein n=1 Tax=Aureitalea sp. L0-47 TaxID=2816962 RepID=UPI00223772E8|nr:hypothetical protein [Aureitalea sp. L0-47]MCW5520193.1 hypothetical protein [Aureitalea sp. L0-47]